MSSASDFVINNGVLEKYRGSDTEVIIPDGVKSIGNGTFYGCSNLKSITIPNSVTSIGSSAFRWCSNLTSITIPDCVTSIGDCAFLDCRSLTSITIPDSVTSIGNEAFQYCCSLTSIKIPNSVTQIGNLAFSDCSNLTSIAISDSVFRIGDGAFRNCKELKLLKMGNSPAKLGEDVFGSQLPSELISQLETLYPHMAASSIKQYVLHKRIWNKLAPELRTKIFLEQHGEELRDDYIPLMKASDLELLGEIITRRMETPEPSVQDCSIAATYMTVFREKAPADILSSLYTILKQCRTGEKAVKTVEADVMLMEKLGTRSSSPAAQIIQSILIGNDKCIQDIEKTVNEYYGLQFKDLPVICCCDKSPAEPFVFAWLLTIHEARIKNKQGQFNITAGYKNSGMCPEVAEVTNLLDPISLQEALRRIADEYLVKYQSTKKKFLAYPVCRYADEATMAELTQRAPKWASSVSGNDAPPLKQFRDAVKYSDTRAAILFAERYHELGAYAKIRGTSADAIRDYYLSDVGLDEQGGKIYDLGNQTVTARLQQDLSFLFELPNDKTAKSLPKKGADPKKYDAANKDFSEMKKAVKKILNSRGKVLFDDFLSGRKRASTDWKNAYLRNPLLRKAASLVVWAQEDKTFTLDSSNPIDSSGQPYRITSKPIRVAHPMEMTSTDTAAWQKYFVVHDLKQPFAQIWEPVRKAEDIGEDRYKGCVVKIYWFNGKDKHGIHSFGLSNFSEDFGFKLDDCELEYEPSTWRLITVSPDASDETYTLGTFRFQTYNRKVNHIVSCLDRITVWDRVRKDDISVMDQIPGFTLAQITEFISAAQEANAVNVLAALLEYKNANFADFDPMAEFTLEW